MSAVKETNQRTSVPAFRSSPPSPVRRTEAQPRIAQPVQPQREEVQLSSRASEIQTSDHLKSNWTDMVSGNPANDPAAAYRSQTKQPLEGYDQAKLDNLDHKTPKYLFGRVAQGFKLDSVQSDKTKAEELLKAMVPDLQAAGLEVVGVSGDKIQVKTELGYEWVDVIRGAGAPGPGWQWGSEGAGTPEPTKNVQEWEARTGVNQAPASGPAAAVGPAPQAGASGSSGPSGPIVLGKQIDSGKVLGILKKYPANGQGLTQAVRDPELQKLYPGVMTYGGHDGGGKAFNADDRLRKGLNVDKLYFPNGAIVDVIKGAGAAGADWGWMPEN